MRQGMNILCWVIAIIIVGSNFTALEKRDILAKRQTENQEKIYALAKGGMEASTRVAAGAESLAKDAGATKTPELMRRGAKGVTDAAEAAKEAAKTNQAAIEALKKAPPPSNADVQGSLAHVMTWAIAIVIFWSSALAARQCGLFLRRAREEYVVTRDQIKTGANIKLQNITEAKALPDAPPKQTPRREPSIPVPAPSNVAPLPDRENRSQADKQRGAIGARKTAPATTPEAQDAPGGGADGFRIDSEALKAALTGGSDAESGEAEAMAQDDAKLHQIDSSGRITYNKRAAVEAMAEPLLRVLLVRGDIDSVTTRSAAEMMRAAGKGMSAKTIGAAVNNLQAAGLLIKSEGYRDGKKVSPYLIEWRKAITGKGIYDYDVSIDDAVNALMGK